MPVIVYYRKHSHRSKHEHKDKDDRHKDRHRDRHRDHSSRHDKNVSKEELEIQEANELRAKLGIAPLKRWNIWAFIYEFSN